MKNLIRNTFGLFLFTVAVLLFNASPENGIIYSVLLGSIAASTTASFQTTFIPQFFAVSLSTVSTSFTINVNGDGVIFNLDGNGMNSCNKIRMVGSVSNLYVFQIADGLLQNKKATWTIANAVAAQIDVYGWSKVKNGGVYITYNSQYALAGSGLNLDKFMFAGFPSAAAADLYTITYRDGLSDQPSRFELNSDLGYTQNVVASRYGIDNLGQQIKSVSFVPVAAQSIYVAKYQAAQGSVNPNVLG